MGAQPSQPLAEATRPVRGYSFGLREILMPIFEEALLIVIQRQVVLLARSHLGMLRFR